MVCFLAIGLSGIDAVGVAVLTSGVVRLIGFADTPRYKTPMRAVALVCGLSFLEAVRVQWGFPGSAFHPISLAVAAAEIAAVFVFIRCMRLLSTWHGLGEVARSWRWTERLWLWIYLVPGGVFGLFSLREIVASDQVEVPAFSFEIRMLVMVALVPLALTPAIYLFVSRSLMEEAARDRR